MIVIKKLNNRNVHFSVVILYACYCGLPFTLAISALTEFTGVNEPRDKALYDTWESLMWQCGYSFTSASCGVLSQIFMNISLKYDEASRISVVRTTDVFFTFILQIFVLGIIANFLSIIGALLILTGTFMVMLYGIADKKFNKPKQNNETTSFFKRLIFFKF